MTIWARCYRNRTRSYCWVTVETPDFDEPSKSKLERIIDNDTRLPGFTVDHWSVLDPKVTI